MQIEYFEDEDGTQMKALVSKTKFETMTFLPTSELPKQYALLITDEIEKAIIDEIEPKDSE